LAAQRGTLQGVACAYIGAIQCGYCCSTGEQSHFTLIGFLSNLRRVALGRKFLCPCHVTSFDRLGKTDQEPLIFNNPTGCATILIEPVIESTFVPELFHFTRDAQLPA
jgi:hypothetical protein